MSRAFRVMLRRRWRAAVKEAPSPTVMHVLSYLNKGDVAPRKGPDWKTWRIAFGRRRR